MLSISPLTVSRDRGVGPAMCAGLRSEALLKADAHGLEGYFDSAQHSFVTRLDYRHYAANNKVVTCT